MLKSHFLLLDLSFVLPFSPCPGNPPCSLYHPSTGLGHGRRALPLTLQSRLGSLQFLSTQVWTLFQRKSALQRLQRGQVPSPGLRSACTQNSSQHPQSTHPWLLPESSFSPPPLLFQGLHTSLCSVCFTCWEISPAQGLKMSSPHWQHLHSFLQPGPIKCQAHWPLDIPALEFHRPFPSTTKLSSVLPVLRDCVTWAYWVFMSAPRISTPNRLPWHSTWTCDHLS